MHELQQILELMATDPAAAADRLDALGDRLKEAAAQLRESGGTVRSPIRDRVMARVVGPDGQTRQYVDTGA